jgi:hypothetical protein
VLVVVVVVGMDDFERTRISNDIFDISWFGGHTQQFLFCFEQFRIVVSIFGLQRHTKTKPYETHTHIYMVRRHK